MGQGPAGIDRPFVKTNLKYDVTVSVSEEIWDNPPKAVDLIDMRVNAVQDDSNQFIKEKVGDVILAANGLAWPSRIKVVSADVERYEPNNLVSRGEVEVTWTYIIQGSGVGSAYNTRTDSRSMWKLHEALEKENDSVIESSSVQREWSPDPYEVVSVYISSE